MSDRFIPAQAGNTRFTSFFSPLVPVHPRAGGEHEIANAARAVGGAAQVLAECVKRVRNVYFLAEFGSPEAIWELEIVDFPAVVTIDAHGHSLHKEIFAASSAELAKRL